MSYKVVSFMLHKITEFTNHEVEFTLSIVICVLCKIIKFFMNYGEVVIFMFHKITKFVMNCFYHETISYFCIAAFASSTRRAIASVRKASIIEKVVHANIELESHADSIVAGANCCIVHCTSR